GLICKVRKKKDVPFVRCFSVLFWLHLGGPEVAASLIFGTFVISLFLILCVAFFFYLKRANKLPNLFYRRSKGSIVQSAESASMLSPPSSSKDFFFFFSLPSLACAKCFLRMPSVARTSFSMNKSLSCIQKRKI
uniref:Uncharacterized protein n=1 Tax=Pseudonaja textilis TaxID=8673 RepID=A0A670YUQ6_PSETE